MDRVRWRQMIFSGYPYRDQVKRRKGVRVPTLKQCFTSGIYQSNTRMNDSTEGVVTK